MNSSHICFVILIFINFLRPVETPEQRLDSSELIFWVGRYVCLVRSLLAPELGKATDGLAWPTCHVEERIVI